MVRIICAKPGQRIVGDARQLGRHVRRADELERRIGQRQHVLHAVEFVDQPQPRLDVDQRLDLRKSREDDMARNECRKAVEIVLWA